MGFSVDKFQRRFRCSGRVGGNVERSRLNTPQWRKKGVRASDFVYRRPNRSGEYSNRKSLVERLREEVIYVRTHFFLPIIGIRDYIHVVDLAKGHVSAVKYLSKFKGCKVVIAFIQHYTFLSSYSPSFNCFHGPICASQSSLKLRFIFMYTGPV